MFYEYQHSDADIYTLTFFHDMTFVFQSLGMWKPCQWNFKFWHHPLHQNDSHLWTMPWVGTIWLSFINGIASWNTKAEITIFIAMLHTQASDALQPDVLTWKWISISKDASMQPRFRGSEVQERRKRTVGSLFLSKYSGKKWKQWVIVTSGWKPSTGNVL